MALSGTKALEAWSKRITADYKNVNIVNMTTSWRSGLGFCAIIHHYYPHLIDYDSLDPDDVFGNNSLAFNVAEQQLGIPSLLDPEDMVECELLGCRFDYLATHWYGKAHNVSAEYTINVSMVIIRPQGLYW